MKLNQIFNMGRKSDTPAAGASVGTTITAIAVPPTSDERAEIVRFIEEKLGPIRTGMASWDRQQEPPIPVELITSIARSITDLVDDTKLAAVRGLAAEWRLAVDAINEFGRDRISAANAKHQAEVARSHIEGEALPDAWTKAEIETDFATRRASLKRAALAKSLEAGQIFAGPAAAVIAELRKHSEDSAVAEFRTYTRYGVEYTPSLLIRTLLAAAGRLEREAGRLASHSAGIGNDPKSMFAIIGIEL